MLHSLPVSHRDDYAECCQSRQSIKKITSEDLVSFTLP